MAVNHEKLGLYTKLPGFKNNKVYTGSFVINKALSGPVTFQNNLIMLDREPDLLSIQFRGPIDTTGSGPPSQRPANSWFQLMNEAEYVTALSYDPLWGPFVPAPVSWMLATEITGKQVNIIAMMPKQYSDNPSYNAITVDYRIVDYSVF